MTKVAMLRELILQINISSSGNQSKVNDIEEELSKGINDFYKDPLFFTLPINQIISILNKSRINNVDTVCDFLEKATKYKKEEAHYLLHCFVFIR